MRVIRSKSLNSSVIARLLLLFLILSMYSVTSFGQEDEGDRGRLPDGRAFRTDLEGAQIVDYIAELEQSVAEQNRKIVSLEDENASIQKEFERIKAGRPEEPAERDLLRKGAESESSAQKEQWLLESCPEPAACPVPSACPVPPPCPFASEPVRAEKQCPVTVCPKIVCPEQDCPECPQPSNQLKDCKPVDCNSCSTILPKCNCAEMQEKQQILRADFSRMEQELIKARTERDRLSAVIQQQAHAKPSAVVCPTTIPVKSSNSPRDLELSRHQAIDAIKERMSNELQLLLNRKEQRDLLFSKYLKERQGLTLSPSSLRARSGRELSQLNELISKAETIRELAIIRIDLEEIRRQMSDDLALVERMSKP